VKKYIQILTSLSD